MCPPAPHTKPWNRLLRPQWEWGPGALVVWADLLGPGGYLFTQPHLRAVRCDIAVPLNMLYAMPYAMLYAML